MPVNPLGNISWPQERIERLLKLVDDGLSAGQIVRAFAADGHRYSRNSIIGKVHRLGQKTRGKTCYAPSKNKPPVVKKIIKPVIVVPALDFIGIVGAAPIQGMCHYVVGEFATLQACGHPATSNKKGRKTCYCDYHQTIVYQKPLAAGTRGPAFTRPIAPAAIAFL